MTFTRRSRDLLWLGLYLMLIMSWIWRDQIAYRASDINADNILAGVSCSPEQYRVLAPYLAHIIQTHLHLHSIIAGSIVIDLLGSILLFTLLYYLLDSLLSARPPALRTAAKVLLGLLIFFYLHWSYLSARVDTVPSCLYLVLSFLCWKRARTATRPIAALYLLAFVLLSLLQGFLRSDVAVITGFGLAAAALCIPARNPAQRSGETPRWLFFLAGATAAAVAGLALLYLMLRVYPQAHRCGGVLALRFNFGEGYAYIPFLTLMPPIVVALIHIARRLRTAPLEDSALFLAALAYIPLWTTVGSWGEARIIAPFAMALAPTAAIAIAQRLTSAEILND